jgi:hypothetical protein
VLRTPIFSVSQFQTNTGKKVVLKKLVCFFFDTKNVLWRLRHYFCCHRNESSYRVYSFLVVVPMSVEFYWDVIQISQSVGFIRIEILG